MRDPKERLKDILEAISKIERYAVRGREAFEQEELLQTWILYHIQLIGEAAAQLGKHFHQSNPEIPWPRIVAMGNVLIHEYFGVDLREVWKTVEKEGLIHTSSSGKKYKKYYLDEARSAIDCIWTDILRFGTKTASTEILGFLTQKPEQLLERILVASSK